MDATATTPRMSAADAMRHAAARQRLIAENVANADTPGFRARDLEPAPVRADSLALARTASGHLDGSLSATPRIVTAPRGERVAVEDEMLKLSEAQTGFQTAASLYAKSLALTRLALGRRG